MICVRPCSQHYVHILLLILIIALWGKCYYDLIFRMDKLRHRRYSICIILAPGLTASKNRTLNPGCQTIESMWLSTAFFIFPLNWGLFLSKLKGGLLQPWIQEVLVLDASVPGRMSLPWRSSPYHGGGGQQVNKQRDKSWSSGSHSMLWEKKYISCILKLVF